MMLNAAIPRVMAMPTKIPSINACWVTARGAVKLEGNRLIMGFCQKRCQKCGARSADIALSPFADCPFIVQHCADLAYGVVADWHNK